MKSNIGGIVLCGGKSSRFGSNKGMYTFKDKELIKYPIELMKKLASDIVVVGPEIVSDDSINFIQDIFPEMGPMGGIHAGLTHSTQEINIVLACDTPFINTDIIDLLLSIKSNADIIIPQTADGKYHPLTGIYRKSCLKVLEQNLIQNKRKLIQFIMEQHYKVVKIEDKESEKLFANFNYLEDAKKHEQT